MATSNVFSFDVLDTKTAAEAGFEVEILKPDGEASGVYITVLGTDSSVYQKLREKFERHRIKTMAKSGRNAIDSLYDAGKDQDFHLVAACTTAWRHEKMDMPFDVSDKEELVAFYKQYPLVFDQVRVAMADRSNFTKAAANS